ncbi:MAG: hypothetical protein IKJ82_08245 [Oscillospiraceae bacterium]|nr:hypothetical protein [Oscillospiraceae bacterium]
MKKEIEKEILAELLGETKEEPAKNEEMNFFGEGELEREEEAEHELCFGSSAEEFEHGDYNFSGHGINFSLPKKAAEEIAAATGKKPEEIIGIFEKGCRFEKVLKELEEAKRDSEVFEKLAAMRGISKEEMRAEIFGALEKAKLGAIIEKLLAENPGMNEETAGELAKFRLEAEKPKTAKEEKENRIEKILDMLREMEDFSAKHRGEGIERLDNSIIEEWEKGSTLERAFENARFAKEKEKLLAEMEQMKLEKEKLERKDYLRKHSPGSATSASGNTVIDAFIEGLFKEY